MRLVFGLDDRLAAPIFGSFAVAEGYRSRLEDVRAEMQHPKKDDRVILSIDYSLSSLPECKPLMLLGGTDRSGTHIVTFGVDRNLSGGKYMLGLPKEKPKE
jgi:hypothetical protein